MRLVTNVVRLEQAGSDTGVFCARMSANSFGSAIDRNENRSPRKRRMSPTITPMTVNGIKTGNKIQFRSFVKRCDETNGGDAEFGHAGNVMPGVSLAFDGPMDPEPSESGGPFMLQPLSGPGTPWKSASRMDIYDCLP
jgi:hypothetical protein